MAATPLETLIADHQTAIWRYLRFLGCSPDEATELTQDTFVRVIDKPVHRFGRSGERAYLRTVAKNLFLKNRAQTRRSPEVDLETAEAAYEWYREDDEGESWTAALRTCLEGLADQPRQALELRFVETLDRTAIASRLGLSNHGVKSILQRAYARLRTCIQRRLEHDAAD